jgi:hypothetical protein
MTAEKTLTLREVVAILAAEVHHTSSQQLDTVIQTARASDLMSDILFDDMVPDILLTRLCNAQVVRTASVFGIAAVVMVRSHDINMKIVELAKEENIVLLATQGTLFTSCGKLYARGVRGVLEIPKMHMEDL